MRVVMVFLDGFGLGRPEALTNPYATAATPFLDRLLGGHVLYEGVGRLKRDSVFLFPTAADLGVAGVPQSATGQTTLWTGVNAAAVVGAHVRGYPSGELVLLLERESIFKQLQAAGKSVAFANAYRPDYFARVARGLRRHSASTLAALAAGLPLRTLDDLREGRAVYQDITNETLRRLGYDVPEFTPQEAGKRLAALSARYDFTLFEYFQTDLAGHRRDLGRARALLELLDAFLEALVSSLDLARSCVLVVSDHGNVEDLSTGEHTPNPVPTLLITAGADGVAADVASLEEITPLVKKLVSL